MTFFMRTLFSLTIFSSMLNSSFADDTLGELLFEKEDRDYIESLTSNWDDMISGDISTRYRYQDSSTNKKTHSQLQYRLRVNLSAPVTEHCKMKARAITGSSYGSAWNDAGLGNDTEFAHDIDIRNFYLQCLVKEHFTLQAGSLEVFPSKDTKGVLGLDDDGWIDGGRVIYENPKAVNDNTMSIKEIALTMGSLDPSDDPAFWDHSWDEPNFYQLHITGNLTEQMQLMFEGTYADMPDEEQMAFFRAQLNIDLNDIMGGLINKMVIEALFNTTSDPFSGVAVSFEKKFGNNWVVATGYMYNNPEAPTLPVQYDFLDRDGGLLFVSITKKITEALSLFCSARQGIHGPGKNETRAECGASYKF